MGLACENVHSSDSSSEQAEVFELSGEFLIAGGTLAQQGDKVTRQSSRLDTFVGFLNAPFDDLLLALNRVLLQFCLKFLTGALIIVRRSQRAKPITTATKPAKAATIICRKLCYSSKRRLVSVRNSSKRWLVSVRTSRSRSSRASRTS